MKKQDIFGSVLRLKSIDTSSQKDFNDFILIPQYEYPFDSSVITTYTITQVSTGIQLRIMPDNLWKELSKFTNEFSIKEYKCTNTNKQQT